MPSILLMDDEFQFCHQMAELLVANGHHIDTAKSASGATELLKHQRYDLLITDIYVYKNGSPASDGGIALIGWIRKQGEVPGFEWLQKMPIIAVSGAVNQQWNPYVLANAESVGATSSFAKPIADAQILSEIDRLTAHIA